MIPAGEAGRIHAVYQKGGAAAAPMAVIVPGGPKLGHHVNDRLNYAMFRAYMDIGFSTLRFDFRGVGDSEGVLGNLDDNLRDIASVIDWVQNQNEEADILWLAGARQGAWFVLIDDAAAGSPRIHIGVAGPYDNELYISVAAAEPRIAVAGGERTRGRIELLAASDAVIEKAGEDRNGNDTDSRRGRQIRDAGGIEGAV